MDTIDDMRPEVSILVPTYGVEKYLCQCLDSLVGQTLENIEVIVIDDGSPDASGDIADEYAARDRRVRVIHKENSGYGDSMNRGIDAARAEWIAICEPDDFAEPMMCEHLLAHARRCAHEGERIDIVKASFRSIITSADGHVRIFDSPLGETVRPHAQPFTVDECPPLLITHPSIWTALYRKDFLDEFAIRFLPIPGAGWADNPFFIETMVAARAIAWLDEIVYNYREFEDGTISRLKDWRVITQRWTEMGSVLEKYDVSIPEIIEAHCCRGCAYLQMLGKDFPQSEELVDAAKAMAATLDHDIICHSSIIPKEYKLAYARFIPPAKRLTLAGGWMILQLRARLHVPAPPLLAPLGKGNAPLPRVDT